MTSGSRRTIPGRACSAAGRAGHWGLVGLLAWLLAGCATAAEPPPASPEPVGIVLGTVTEPVRWHRPGRGTIMVDTAEGPSFVRVRPTTPIRLHTIGQLQPLGAAGIAVGDRVTIRVAGVILTSSPSQITAAEIIVVR
ncbi:MAG TPA: hypothetical protein VGE07_15870 [Herpetosiphonaceae bacterium]